MWNKKMGTGKEWERENGEKKEKQKDYREKKKRRQTEKERERRIERVVWKKIKREWDVKRNKEQEINL